MINSPSPEDWQPLFDLIGEIRQERNFGTPAIGKPDANGVMEFPYWKHTDIVSRFIELAYKLDLVIPFDWPNWKEGKSILNDPGFDYNTLDPETLCKLITMMVRADRYNDGYLISCFESGIVLKILESLKGKVI